MVLCVCVCAHVIFRADTVEEPAVKRHKGEESAPAVVGEASSGSPALKLLTSRGSGEASAQQALDRDYDVDYANVLGEGM